MERRLTGSLSQSYADAHDRLQTFSDQGLETSWLLENHLCPMIQHLVVDVLPVSFELSQGPSITMRIKVQAGIQ